MRTHVTLVLVVGLCVGCNETPSADNWQETAKANNSSHVQQEDGEKVPDPDFIEFGKGIADIWDRPFDEEQWIAERNKKLTPEESDQLAIDLGFKPHPDQTKEFAESQLSQLFANAQNFDILQDATDGEFYFIEPTSGFKDRLGNYKRTSRPVKLPQNQLEGLTDALCDARNYGWVAARKGCLPSPGIVLRINKKNKEISVVFCFACNLLTFYHNDIEIGGEDFDIMRPQFVTALKKLYPKNDLIQGLPSNGCGLTKSQ